MSYIGRNIENLASRTKLDSISTSATATFNLLLNSVAYVPSSAESLTVSLNGVIQAPQSSYTVSGSTIVFASNLASSDVIDFILAERAITLTTIGSGTVTTSNIVDANVTTAKIADNAVTSAKLASGLLPTNTPAFHVELSGTQTIGDAVTTKVQFNTEVYDTNNNYDNSSNYRFTPQTAGKYFCYLAIKGGVDGVSRLSQFSIEIRKNGAQIAGSGSDFRSDAYGLGSFGTCTVGVSLNGSSDYLEAFCYINDQSGANTQIYGGKASVFGAYKLIGA